MSERQSSPVQKAVTSTSAWAVAVTLAVAVTFVLGCRNSATQEGAAEPAQEAIWQASGETAPKWRTPLGKPRGGLTWSKHIPNVVLTTHRGKKMKFYDDLVKDKVVVINFMYATCTNT